MIKKLVCIPHFFLWIIRLNVSRVICTFTGALNTVAFFFKKKKSYETSNFLNLKTGSHNIFTAEGVFPP